jgi:hypothetical protein
MLLSSEWEREVCQGIHAYVIDLLGGNTIRRDDEEKEEEGKHREGLGGTRYDAVIPGKYGKFIQTSD